MDDVWDRWSAASCLHTFLFVLWPKRRNMKSGSFYKDTKTLIKRLIMPPMISGCLSAPTTGPLNLIWEFLKFFPSWTQIWQFLAFVQNWHWGGFESCLQLELNSQHWPLLIQKSNAHPIVLICHVLPVSDCQTSKSCSIESRNDSSPYINWSSAWNRIVLCFEFNSHWWQLYLSLKLFKTHWCQFCKKITT